MEWITNYFTNRKQYVEYNGAKSNKGYINIGVPQGSILGPRLFLLYINDLSNTSSKLYFVQFADDSSVFISSTSLSAISKILNDEMMNICDWLKSSMLTLNVTKTNYMIMTNQGRKYNDKDCVLTIEVAILFSVSYTTFLGLILDDKFTWKNHTDYISYIDSKLAGILNRVKKLLTKYTLVTLYSTLLKPYFTYCISICGNTCKPYLKALKIIHMKISGS